MHRRSLLAGVLGSLISDQAFAAIRFGDVARRLLLPQTQIIPTVHISHGQSWRSNSWDTFATYGINPQPQTLGCIHTTNPNPGGISPPGCLPGGSGIFIPGIVNGLSGYAPSDPVTIGRCAVLAYQLLCLRANMLPLVPCFEMAWACPSSDWVQGDCPNAGFPAGGLGPGTQPWVNGQTMISAVQQYLPWYIAGVENLGPPIFRSVGWTQGGALTPNYATTQTQWGQMTAAFDALNLPGTSTTPLRFYCGIPAMASNLVVNNANVSAIYDFIRTNSNGRTIGTTTWYQWPFDPTGSIHTWGYGTTREGECEGYAKYVVEKEGTLFTPLWRHGAGSITTSGQIITIPWSRPSGSAFAGKNLILQSDANDGIKVWPNNGFNVKRISNGSTLTPTVSVSGMNVLLNIAEILVSGESLEISYANYGPGGPSPGPCSGVGGNLTIAGPPSVFYAGLSILSWAWPFVETIVVP